VFICFQFLKKWKVLSDKVHWVLLFHKRHLKRRGLLKAYKAHNPSIPWQCGTLNTPPHVWHYCPNTCTTGGKAQHCPRPWSFDTMIKSIEPYSSTKGTLREEVCSRLIKPTTQVYLGNVGLLTLRMSPLTNNARLINMYKINLAQHWLWITTAW